MGQDEVCAGKFRQLNRTRLVTTVGAGGASYAAHNSTMHHSSRETTYNQKLATIESLQQNKKQLVRDTTIQ